MIYLGTNFEIYSH